MVPEHVQLPLHPKKNSNYIFLDDDVKEKFENEKVRSSMR